VVLLRFACLPILVCSLADRCAGEGQGPALGPPQTQRLQVGLIVKAQGGACRGIVATAPVPMEWPEQSVRIAEENVSPRVKKVSYRQVEGTARQMVIEIPQLAAGEEAQALVTFEIARHTLAPPQDTTAFVLPQKLDRQLRAYLAESPSIESRHPKIRALAKEAAAGKQSAWETVEALYDTARDKVQYKFGPLKGGLKALEDGEGDCEDISSLFIALCRANDIPARTVWVGRPSSGHCYPEFYLADAAGNGYWLPCQAAGDRAFGGMPELRPILQKGDNFRVPEHRERQRYIAEFFRAADAKGQPSVRFVCESL
jgi:transglutaminase-like putative cysteine protease